MSEQWKDIKEYEGLYQISNYGRIKSLNRIIICSDGQLKPIKEKYIKFGNNGTGYKFCYLWKNNKSTRFYIHRLVAEYFVENINKDIYNQVNHIDGNRSNNYYKNLEWCSPSMNMFDSYKRYNFNTRHRPLIQIYDDNEIVFYKSRKEYNTKYNCSAARNIRRNKKLYDVNVNKRYYIRDATDEEIKRYYTEYYKFKNKVPNKKMIIDFVNNKIVYE